MTVAPIEDENDRTPKTWDRITPPFRKRRSWSARYPHCTHDHVDTVLSQVPARRPRWGRRANRQFRALVRVPSLWVAIHAAACL